MAVLAACMLVADLYLDPLYPFLLLVILLLALAACTELHRLLRPCRTGRRSGCASAACSPCCWPTGRSTSSITARRRRPAKENLGLDPWQFVTFTFAAVVMTAFVVEMPRYKDSSGAVPRIALAFWFVAYLGLLPSFLVQLRWPPPQYGVAEHWPSSCRSSATWRLLHRPLSGAAPHDAGAQSQEDLGGVRRRHGRGGRGGLILNHFYLKEVLNGNFASAFQYDTVLHGGDWRRWASG